MTRLEIATHILAGICSNPADAYTQSGIAVDKALLLADCLIAREEETVQEVLRKSAGHE